MYHQSMAGSERHIRFPESARTVAVYGGTFDPPTRAHVELPLAVADAIGADHLLIIPASASPFKPGGAHATDEQRLRMLELAFGDRAGVTVTPIEIERGGASYTVDTLRDLTCRFPGITFRLIIGADQAESFHRWREAGAILDLAEPAVMLRGDSAHFDAGVAGLLESMAPHWTTEELEAWRARIVKAPTIDASSTEARALLASHSPDDKRLSQLLLPEVLDYISRSGLYGAGENH